MARDTIDPNSKLHPRAVYNGETGRREEAPPSSLKSSNGIQLSFSFGWPKVVLRARNKNGNSRDAKIRLEIDLKEVFEAGRVNLIDERGEFVEGEEKGCSFVNRDRVPRIVMAIAQLLARTLPRHVALRTPVGFDDRSRQPSPITAASGLNSPSLASRYEKNSTIR